MSIQPQLIRRHAAFPENDPDMPFFIWARSPANRAQPVRVAANKWWLEALEEDQLYQGIAQYAAHLHGFVPVLRDDSPAVDRVSDGLAAAHALFKGLRRDLIDPGRDRRMFVYVINPVDDFGYRSSSRWQQFPSREPKPLRSVFAAYVDFDSTAIDFAREMYGPSLPADVTGVVHRWEWVTPLDHREPFLPVDFDTRYEERLWS